MFAEGRTITLKYNEPTKPDHAPPGARKNRPDSNMYLTREDLLYGGDGTNKYSYIVKPAKYGPFGCPACLITIITVVSLDVQRFQTQR